MSDKSTGDYYECSQGGCPFPAVARYTWPGQNERFACALCGAMLQRLAAAMGHPIQYISLYQVDREETPPCES